LPGIAAFGDAVDFLEDDLTNRHPLLQPDLERAETPPRIAALTSRSERIMPESPLLA
jgi:hypothetical protein